MKTPKSPYRPHRFPPDIIQHAVWLYQRFSLSFRDIEDLLAERGVCIDPGPSATGAGAARVTPGLDGLFVYPEKSGYLGGPARV